MALPKPRCQLGNQLCHSPKIGSSFKDGANHLVCWWSLCSVQIIKHYICSKCKKSTSVKTSYRMYSKKMPRKPQVYQKNRLRALSSLSHNDSGMTTDLSCIACDSHSDSRTKLNLHKRSHRVTRQADGVEDKQKLNVSDNGRCELEEVSMTSECKIPHTDKIASGQSIAGVFQESDAIKQYVVNESVKEQINITLDSHPFKSDRCPSSIINKTQLKRTVKQRLHAVKLKLDHQQLKSNQRQEQPFTPKKKVRKSKKSYKGVSKDNISSVKVKKHCVCSDCGKSFKLPSRLRRHLKVHTGAKPFKCTVCGKGFSSNQSLQNHRKFVAANNLQCDVCEMQFCTNFTFTTHKVLHSLSSETYGFDSLTFQCRMCEKVFTSMAALSSHTSVHNNTQSYKCEICDTLFAQESDLQNHLKSRTSECVLADSLDGPQAPVFIGSKSLSMCCPKSAPKQHQVYHCDTCARTFHQEQYYKVHMLSHSDQNIPLPKGGQQQGDKTFLCDRCPECFNTRAYLMAHTIAHTDKSLTCTICHKPYRYLSRLSEHMLFHTREKPYRCSVCGKNYPYYGSLQSHMLIHTDLKPFRCEVCCQCFIKKCELVKHLSVHTGEKRHMCEECGKCFRTWSSLHTHDKTHTGEKPHKCGQCGKGFVTRGHLKTHMRIHTGEKPYCCEICGKQCTIKGNLHKHMATHRKRNSDKKAAEMGHVNAEADSNVMNCGLYWEHTVPDAVCSTYQQSGTSFQSQEMYQFKC
ncbi:zinc finger protein 708-like [Gigantopelta aegis]|uniref:zinc finger protein 708-like n=1 Tax=Gigantopelta aegis TaxID=1735272 RepID=UPI001B88B126|nr:zinc finger protein 708-like [Gigantopelta aegis]